MKSYLEGRWRCILQRCSPGTHGSEPLDLVEKLWALSSGFQPFPCHRQKMRSLFRGSEDWLQWGQYGLEVEKHDHDYHCFGIIAASLSKTT